MSRCTWFILISAMIISSNARSSQSNYAEQIMFNKDESLDFKYSCDKNIESLLKSERLGLDSNQINLILNNLKTTDKTRYGFLNSFRLKQMISIANGSNTDVSIKYKSLELNEYLKGLPKIKAERKRLGKTIINEEALLLLAKERISDIQNISDKKKAYINKKIDFFIKNQVLLNDHPSKISANIKLNSQMPVNGHFDHLDIYAPKEIRETLVMDYILAHEITHLIQMEVNKSSWKSYFQKHFIRPSDEYLLGEIDAMRMEFIFIKYLDDENKTTLVEQIKELIVQLKLKKYTSINEFKDEYQPELKQVKLFFEILNNATENKPLSSENRLISKKLLGTRKARLETEKSEIINFKRLIQQFSSDKNDNQHVIQDFEDAILVRKDTMKNLKLEISFLEETLSGKHSKSYDHNLNILIKDSQNTLNDIESLTKNEHQGSIDSLTRILDQVNFVRNNQDFGQYLFNELVIHERYKRTNNFGIAAKDSHYKANRIAYTAIGILSASTYGIYQYFSDDKPTE